MFLVPFFFMDLGDAASVEEKAAFDRHARLLSLAEQKMCTVPAELVDANPAEKLEEQKSKQ